MADRRVMCPVEDGPEAPTREVNAFRVVPDTGRSYLLDFISYSPALLRAEVVQRVRIHDDLLEAVRNRLNSELMEMPAQGISISWPDGLEVS